MVWGASEWRSLSTEEFMKVPMIARMKFNYAGRDLKVDDEFDATEKDAFALRTYGRAKNKDGHVEPRTKRQYRRRDMTAQQ